MNKKKEVIGDVYKVLYDTCLLCLQQSNTPVNLRRKVIPIKMTRGDINRIIVATKTMESIYLDEINPFKEGN